MIKRDADCLSASWADVFHAPAQTSRVWQPADFRVSRRCTRLYISIICMPGGLSSFILSVLFLQPPPPPPPRPILHKDGASLLLDHPDVNRLCAGYRFWDRFCSRSRSGSFYRQGVYTKDKNGISKRWQHASRTQWRELIWTGHRWFFCWLKVAAGCFCWTTNSWDDKMGKVFVYYSTFRDGEFRAGELTRAYLLRHSWALV